MFRPGKSAITTGTRSIFCLTRQTRSMSTKSYGIAKNGTAMKVELNEKEAKICDVLKGVSGFIAKERPELPLIESRIAGGWVRDKLLGKDCHDLDVAINDMMGYEFATYVNKYLESMGVPTRSIAKIDSNPEKSKHLETATTKLFDQEIDFCNLRKEVYEEGSRIPTKITFGTPTEDAYRRDTTINSLFYNVNTNLVEDFTNQGIPDLISGLIRTPLEPFETFFDDPLRVLRCVRFASRLDFELVPELCEAAKNSEIKDALKHKISRERIGIEFEKMITGPHPLLSLRLIHDLELYSIIMSPPSQNNIENGTIGDSSTAVKAVGIIDWLCLRNKPQVEALKATTKQEQRTLILAGSTLPFLGVMSVEPKKKKEIPAVQLVLRDSIKTNNADINTVSTLFTGVGSLKGLAEKSSSAAADSVSRSELGMVIRELGALWSTGIKLAAAKDILDAFPDAPWTQPEQVPGDLAKDICARYDALIQLAHHYGIADCYTWKHMVDGKRSAQVVGIRPGPQVSELLQFQMTWMLDHPQGTREECEEALKAYWESKQQQQ